MLLPCLCLPLPAEDERDAVLLLFFFLEPSPAMLIAFFFEPFPSAPSTEVFVKGEDGTNILSRSWA